MNGFAVKIYVGWVVLWLLNKTSGVWTLILLGAFGPWDFEGCLAVYSIYRVVQMSIKMILKGFYMTKNLFWFLSLKSSFVMAPVHSIYNSISYLLFHSQLTQHCFLCTLVCSSGLKAFLKFPRETERDIKKREKAWRKCVDSLAFSSLFTFFYICLQKGKNLF